MNNSYNSNDKNENIINNGKISKENKKSKTSEASNLSEENIIGKSSCNDVTDVVFILDKSGSMHGLEKDTIGGFNSMLEKQKKQEGEAFVTTVLFDNNYYVVHNRVPLENVTDMTEKDYSAGGTTALLDAIGITVNNIKFAHKSDSKKVNKVLFIIITDGMENSSLEYNYDTIRKIVETQKKECGWEFIFMGANIDAITTAKRFGIDKDMAVDYHADSEGTNLNFKVVSEAISGVRCGVSLAKTWKADIEQDYQNRKRKDNR